MRTLIALIALTFTGCDAAESVLRGNADAGPSGVVVEAEATTAVAELDADAVCVAFYQAVTRQVPNATRCVVPGLIAGADADEGGAQAACTSAASTCTRVASLGTGALPDLPSGPCIFTQPDPDACDATLELLQPCLDAMADTATGQIQTSLTCALADTTGIPDVQVNIPEADEVQACAAFGVVCPGFFGRPEADDAGVSADAG
jgi:hypothetical protein